MFATYTPLLDSVIAKINSSIASQGEGVGVRVTDVNLLMPDGHPVTLHWNEQAFADDDGTFRGDWEISI